MSNIGATTTPARPTRHTARRRGSLRGSFDASDKNYAREHPQMWELMSTYLSPEKEDIKQFIVNHIEYTLARSRFNFDDDSTYTATALSIRDRMIEFWNDTQQFFTTVRAKRVYYFSIEYLMGRSMLNALINIGLKGPYAEGLKDLNYCLEELAEQENDAALGNGGLGRLAACFLDSLATLNYPAWGYGIRYQYGMLHQEIRNGEQVEQPDFWLAKGNPWEIVRNDVTYPVRFYGHVTTVRSTKNREKFIWDGGEIVIAVAYDTPIPGFGTKNILNLRLWSSAPNQEFDLTSFNNEDYYNALKARQHAQNITSVLYPNDKTHKGKTLRLQQQYFFCSASLRDILRRFKKTHKNFQDFPKMAAIQLNDTHPVISIPELMRVLMDEENLGWEESFEVVTSTFAYTNHTVLPEALEKWSVELIKELLPRHLMIIFELNRRFLEAVAQRFPGDSERLGRMSLIEESEPKMVRMANLAIVCSHSVNGVAALHSEILKDSIFREFYEMYPNKFNNKTNGVTPRRWIVSANPKLSDLFTKKLGSPDWIVDLAQTYKLRDLADNAAFQQQFADIKYYNKTKLRQLIYNVTNGELEVDPNALFDIHVKRIHEYKRQLLNIIGIISRWLIIKDMTPEERKNVVPRVCIFAGKAAPGYYAAKDIIKLINSVAQVVNHDPEIGNLLKITFLPNYNVSLAEVIVPASDISQHISTAGTEASGTSNMKFSMNGGLILGTLDGANIEIREEAGPENMFIFGALADQVPNLRQQSVILDERMHEALQTIESGAFGPFDGFRRIIDPLWNGNDWYLLGHDFPSYMDAQAIIDQTFMDKKEWVKRCIMASVSMGKFSSDTTIHAYASEIWDLKPIQVPFGSDAVYQTGGNKNK